MISGLGRVSNIGNIGRIPPHNIEAERSVLGAMLIDKEAIPKVIETLGEEADAFYVTAHQLTYSAVLSLFAKSVPVDIVTLTEELHHQDNLNKVGGPTYLYDMQQSVPTAANVEYYASIVHQKAMLRSLIQAAGEIIANSYEEDEDAESIIDKAERKIFEVAQSKPRHGFTHIKGIMDKSYDDAQKLYHKKQHIIGVPTGFKDLDLMTSGLQPSDFIIIAGRPSMGKSILAHDIARYVSIREKIPVAIFSLEMSMQVVALRMWAAESGIEFHKIRTGFVADTDWQKLTMALGKLASSAFYIDDTPGIGIMELRAKSRRLKAEHGDLGLIVIDYLQLMQGKTKGEGRQQEISEISRCLKELARELNVPVVALSQLNRLPEHRPDRRPQLSDLRESGSLEQDADLVMFIYRDEYYDKNQQDFSTAEILIRKHRNGPSGVIYLQFRKKEMRFANLENDQR